MPTLTLLDVLIITVATLYLAEVVTSKDGPFGVFKRLRELPSVGVGFLSCIWCVAPWMAVGVLAIYYLVWSVLVWPFAIAGLALALRSYTGVQHS